LSSGGMRPDMQPGRRSVGCFTHGGANSRPMRPSTGSSKTRQASTLRPP
jgi:hypothetical protein